MHRLKLVIVDGERYVSDNILDQVSWLRHRSEEIYHTEEDKTVALNKLYQIIGMLSVEDTEHNLLHDYPTYSCRPYL